MDTKTERIVKQNRPHSCKPPPEASAFADPHLILLNEK